MQEKQKSTICACSYTPIFLLIVCRITHILAFLLSNVNTGAKLDIKNENHIEKFRKFVQELWNLPWNTQDDINKQQLYQRFSLDADRKKIFQQIVLKEQGEQEGLRWI